MFDAIRTFQGANGLDIDAKIRPGGPTALLLNARVDTRRRGRKAPPAITPRASVGENGANDPTDVVQVRTTLDRAGYDPVSDPGFAAHQMDPNLVHAFRIFQMDFNLPIDGRLASGGRTATRLGEIDRPLLAAERGSSANRPSASQRKPGTNNTRGSTAQSEQNQTLITNRNPTKTIPSTLTSGVPKLSDQQKRERDKAVGDLNLHSPYEPVFLMQFNTDSTKRINALTAPGDMVEDEPGG